MIVGFSTGLDSFMNPADIGPLYPFGETGRWLFVIAAVVLWLLWHAGQIAGETRENRESAAACEELGLERVMYHGGSALVATDQEWDEAARHGYPGALGRGGAAAPRDPGSGIGPPPPTAPGPSAPREP
jgi:hypothetical protein